MPSALASSSSARTASTLPNRVVRRSGRRAGQVMDRALARGYAPDDADNPGSGRSIIGVTEGSGECVTYRRWARSCANGPGLPHHHIPGRLVSATDHRRAVQAAASGLDCRALAAAWLDRRRLVRRARDRSRGGDPRHQATAGWPGAATRSGRARPGPPGESGSRARNGPTARPAAGAGPSARAGPDTRALPLAGQASLTGPVRPRGPFLPRCALRYRCGHLIRRFRNHQEVYTMDRQVKYVLQESDMPRQWYNVIADLPSPPPPPLHPGTGQPVGPDDLAPLFPAALIAQEVSPERFIDIPDPVVDVYRLWRPTPLFRARRLEKVLGTPARIYYKYEGTSPAGSHKPNTAVPQAYYNAAEGVTKLTTETGAGQWGSALAFASALYGIACEVWMVRASYDQKPYRRLLMEAYGATVHPSPSDITSAGKAVLAENPDSTGSLGIAISEAVEVAAPDPATRYALGSVLNHVLMHQTIIGEEALKQLADAGDFLDKNVGCTGGGSNFGGLAFPFLREKLAGRMNPVIRAVEPAACPSFTRGTYAYDFGDTAGFTPLLKMHTLGHDFVPDPIHAGGLRYHGMSPLLSHIYELGLIEAVAKPQSECFEAGVLFARTEGILPAPEPTH